MTNSVISIRSLFKEHLLFKPLLAPCLKLLGPNTPYPLSLLYFHPWHLLCYHPLFYPFHLFCVLLHEDQSSFFPGNFPLPKTRAEHIVDTYLRTAYIQGGNYPFSFYMCDMVHMLLKDFHLLQSKS